MTENDRLTRLQNTADTLMEKISLWVDTLDPETAGTQTVRHLCATLKDLKELSLSLAPQEQQGLTVTIEGGEEAWNS